MATDLADIASRAATLWERLDLVRAGAETRPPAPAPGVDSLLNAWRDTIGAERFERRLAFEGVTADLVREALGVRVTVTPWISTLRAIVDTTQGADLVTVRADRALRTDQPIPFEEFWVGALRYARVRATLEAFSRGRSVVDAFERDLLLRLSTLAYAALEQTWRRGQPPGARWLSSLLGTPMAPSAHPYDSFIATQLSDGGLGLYEAFPVLARLVATTVDCWVDSTREFFLRLDEDWERLGLPDEPISDIAIGQSDRHHGHRTVHILRWRSGRRLVYKPRPLAADVSFSELVAWVNDRAGDALCLTPQTWDFGTHGWAQFIAHQPCDSDAALEAYYVRAGALVGLCHALQSTDLHRENLVAHGDWPVVVDAETMLQPTAVSIVATPLIDLSTAPMAAFEHSVAKSGLLPLLVEDADGITATDISGLGATSTMPGRIAVVTDINTDAMRIVTVQEPARIGANSPTLDTNHDPRRHLDALTEGLARMQGVLLASRADLLAVEGPLARTAAHRVRFLFRSTFVYAAVLDRSIRLACLSDGCRRSIELDRISVAFLASAKRPAVWPLLRAELDALERLDTPVFAAHGADTTVRSVDMPPLSEGLAVSALDRARTALHAMNQEDARFQRHVCRGAFETRRILSSVVPPPPMSPDERSVAVLSQQEALREAVSIGRTILDVAVESPETDAAFWLGLREALGYRVCQPLGYTVYDGRLGVALFMAVLARVTGAPSFERLARRTLAPFITDLAPAAQTAPARFARCDIGGLAGLGSLVYGLAHAGHVLQDRGAIDAARHMARILTHELIYADRELDLVNGTAGALLGLLACASVTMDEEAIRRACWCGDHLLASRHVTATGLRAWRSGRAPTALAGMSHGASGIALALLRLFEVTRHGAYLDAALEGLAYERALFDEQLGQWPDLRAQGSPLVSWCHGAPGIGLARVRALAIVQRGELREDLSRAIAATLAASPASVDHLCCGEFGRVAFLAAADRRDDAVALAARTRTRARTRHGYRLIEGAQTVFAPGLFQGLAGVGYEWLRLARPDVAAEVLTLDVRPTG